MADAQWMRAKTSFFGAAQIDGRSVEVDVAAGQVVRADHPAIAGREQMFEPLDEDRPQRARGSR